MEILILNNEYPPLGGGAGVCTKFHAQGLAGMGHQVTVITAWYQGEQKVSEVGNLRIIRLESLRKSIFKSNPIEMLSWAFCAIKYIKSGVKEKQFDVCLANYAMPSGMVARYIQRTKKIPYIIISHGEDIPFVHKERMFFYHLINYYPLKHIFGHSVFNIVLSGFQKKKIDAFLGNSKSLVIANGSDASAFHPDFSKKSEKFKILFVGRLQSVKAPLVFLKAIRLLNMQNKNFIVSILGDGPLLVHLKKFVKKNHLEHCVCFKGWVSKNEMIEEYQSAHVQVMSSKFEAFSISALESLFSGVYLISTPVSGNTDLIEENVNGNLFPFGDYRKLAKLLDEYYHLKFLTKYQSDPVLFERIKEKYSWKSIINQYDKLLSNL